MRSLRQAGGRASRLVWLALVITGASQAWSKESPPPVAREFRAAWVATVYNIDWPSKPGLPANQQKEEFRRILDSARGLGLNAILLQVRPGCDAFYASEIEPWSYYLTGKMGKAPSPFYDPLEFATEEAHARGIELHAWFNPFRARPATKVSIDSHHVCLTHPSAVRACGSNLWLDPSLEFSRERALEVVTDVVRRYDIDGVHIDDYFYPYPGSGPSHFDDDASWRQYLSSGGNLDRGDWRRSHIDGFVRSLYEAIKAEKRWVKFGIAPFGIWRPGNPPQVEASLDAYDEIFADSRKWLQSGWVDYFSPQLYWRIDGPHSFAALFNWWSDQNTKRRHLWPGIATSRLGNGEDPGRPASEILRQVSVSRSANSPHGHIHWSYSALGKNYQGIAGQLKRTAYPEPALVPACPWLSGATPDTPVLREDRSSGGIEWLPGANGSIAWWVVQLEGVAKWSTHAILPGSRTRLTIPAGSASRLAVTAVDRFGNESAPAVMILSKEK